MKIKKNNGGHGEQLINGVFIWDDEKVLGDDSGDGCTTLRIYLLR